MLQLEQDQCRVPTNAALLLESALRDELQARMELLQQQQRRESAASLEQQQQRLFQLEMASDLLVTVIRRSQAPTEMESTA